MNSKLDSGFQNSGWAAGCLAQRYALLGIYTAEARTTGHGDFLDS